MLNESETVFVCDIRVDRYLKCESIVMLRIVNLFYFQSYVTVVSEPMSSTSLERLSVLIVSQDTQFTKKVLLVMALVSLELIVKEV